MIKYIFDDRKKRDITIGKLVCLARTYKKHAEEMKSEIPKNPLIFLKPASSVIFNGDSIVKPKMSKCLHHEVELGIVIGKKCKNISKNNALDYVKKVIDFRMELAQATSSLLSAKDREEIEALSGLPTLEPQQRDRIRRLLQGMAEEVIDMPAEIPEEEEAEIVEAEDND